MSSGARTAASGKPASLFLLASSSAEASAAATTAALADGRGRRRGGEGKTDEVRSEGRGNFAPASSCEERAPFDGPLVATETRTRASSVSARARSERARRLLLLLLRLKLGDAGDDESEEEETLGCRNTLASFSRSVLAPRGAECCLLKGSMAGVAFEGRKGGGGGGEGGRERGRKDRVFFPFSRRKRRVKIFFFALSLFSFSFVFSRPRFFVNSCSLKSHADSSNQGKSTYQRGRTCLLLWARSLAAAGCRS